MRLRAAYHVGHIFSVLVDYLHVIDMALMLTIPRPIVGMILLDYSYVYIVMFVYIDIINIVDGVCNIIW